MEGSPISFEASLPGAFEVILFRSFEICRLYPNWTIANRDSRASAPISRQVRSNTFDKSNVFQGNLSVLKSLRNLRFSKWNGAQKRTRTSTPFRVPAPEAGASTNSAIWATDTHVRGWPSGVNRVFEVFVSIVKKAVEIRVKPGPQPRCGSGQVPVPARSLPRFHPPLPHSNAFPVHFRRGGNG